MSRWFLALSLVLLVACTPQTPVARDMTTDEAAGYTAWALEQLDEQFVLTRALLEAASGSLSEAKTLYPTNLAPLESLDALVQSSGAPTSLSTVRASLLQALFTDSDPAKTKTSLQTLLQELAPVRATVATWPVDRTALTTIQVALLRAHPGSTQTGLDALQAAVRGAEKIWLLWAGVRGAQPELAKKIDTKFSLLYGLLDVQTRDGKLRAWAEVYPKEIQAFEKTLDSLADALAELLHKSDT